jgi:hypothetical protein
MQAFTLKRAFSTLAVMLAVTAGTVAVAGTPAQAGFNGQHIGIATGAWSVWIDGTNEFGNRTTQCVYTPNVYPKWSPDNVSNWWWKGNTKFYAYTTTNCSGSSYACKAANVPANQGFNDWYVADLPKLAYC